MHRATKARLGGALLALSALTIGIPVASAEEKPMERTVTVSATGQVGAEPDMARVSSGVVSEAETAREALTRNSAAMKKLIAGLKSAGVDAKDIQTTSFHVEPRYTNPRDGQPPVINGYRVVNQVEIRVRDLARLGELLDSLVTLGANQMSGLSFEVSKAETLKDEARRAAMTNALRRARLFAEAAGATVGEVVSIAEDVQVVGGPRPFAMARKAVAEAVPVESGSETLEARVTVTWALK
jgi:hypothetical protein